MRKRFLSTVVCAALISSVIPHTALADDDFTDISRHWARSQIEKWSDRDVVNGSEGVFRPEDYITRGEAAVIINRLMGYTKEGENYFSDLKAGEFYTQPILKLVHAGVMSGYPEGTVYPTERITRQEAVVMLSNAFDISTEDKREGLPYKDTEKIASFAINAVRAFTTEGYIHGDTENQFNPTAPIKRAEFVVILDNMISSYLPMDEQAVSSESGILLVNQPNVTVSDKTADTVFVAAGVGEGDVILDHVTADKLVIEGGGMHSVLIKGNSKIKVVQISKQDTGVRVRVEGNAVTDVVYINDGCDDVILSGTFKNIAVDSSQNTIRLEDAVVKNLTITGKNVNMYIDKNSAVDTISVADSAENTKVTAEGKVENVNVENPSSQVTVEESEGSGGGSGGGGSGGGNSPNAPVVTVFGLTLFVTEGGSAYAEEVTGMIPDDEDKNDDPSADDPIDPSVDGYPLIIRAEGKGVVIAAIATDESEAEDTPTEEEQHILRLEIVGKGTVVVEEIGR
ncbi:MAG: S-layer homology domain-containing protein [Parabacteroides sp.]|nr:S-layer homology domain-containing protein [Parabacteroides sp.]